jgi:hypothetical protein
VGSQKLCRGATGYIYVDASRGLGGNLVIVSAQVAGQGLPSIKEGVSLGKAAGNFLAARVVQ